MTKRINESVRQQKIRKTPWRQDVRCVAGYGVNGKRIVKKSRKK